MHSTSKKYRLNSNEYKPCCPQLTLQSPILYQWGEEKALRNEDTLEEAMATNQRQKQLGFCNGERKEDVLLFSKNTEDWEMTRYQEITIYMGQSLAYYVNLNMLKFTQGIYGKIGTPD